MLMQFHKLDFQRDPVLTDPDFLVGERAIAEIFKVSTRTFRRYLRRTGITLPVVNNRFVFYKPHLYFLWARMIRNSRKSSVEPFVEIGLLVLKFHEGLHTKNRGGVRGR